MSDWDHAEVREVDWVSGAAMLIRAETVEQIGLLDEGFFWGSEDVDFCWRAHQAGWQVLYAPHPEIVHAVGSSSRQAALRTIVREHRGMYRLYSKHWSRWFGGRWLVWLCIGLRTAAATAVWLGQCLLSRGRSARTPRDAL
jgi:GT2 family glycosyltransferase